MRKICLLFLLLLFLAGCAANVPEQTAPPVESAASAAPTAFVPGGYSAAETAAMSSFMSANRCLIAGDRLYGLDYDESLQPVLASCRLRGGRPFSFRILCADCVPEFLTLHEGCLYYLNGGRLERLTLKSGARETLLEGPLRSLQLYEDNLFFVDEAGHFLRADLGGGDVELLIEGPCDYAWVMPEGILYQSESEGCCLRLRLQDGSDRRLTAAASYAPLRIENTIWYSQRDSEGSVIAAVDLTDGTVTRCDTPALRGTAELIPVGGEWLLRAFLDTEGWEQQLLRPGETEGEGCAYSGYRLCDWVGETRRIDAAYDPDGRLRCFVLVDAEDNELRYFGGKILE